MPKLRRRALRGTSSASVLSSVNKPSNSPSTAPIRELKRGIARPHHDENSSKVSCTKRGRTQSNHCERVTTCMFQNAKHETQCVYKNKLRDCSNTPTAPKTRALVAKRLREATHAYAA